MTPDDPIPALVIVKRRRRWASIVSGFLIGMTISIAACAGIIAWSVHRHVAG